MRTTDKIFLGTLGASAVAAGALCGLGNTFGLVWALWLIVSLITWSTFNWTKWGYTRMRITQYTLWFPVGLCIGITEAYEYIQDRGRVKNDGVK